MSRSQGGQQPGRLVFTRREPHTEFVLDCLDGRIEVRTVPDGHGGISVAISAPRSVVITRRELLLKGESPCRPNRKAS